jgi:hypothetical protein
MINNVFNPFRKNSLDEFKKVPMYVILYKTKIKYPYTLNNPKNSKSSRTG